MARGDEGPHPSGWVLRYADRQAEVGWRSLLAQAPNNAAEAWAAIVGDPRSITTRQHRLKGTLASGRHGGKVLEQWQYEVTSGGRVWYLVDDEAKTLWIVQAGTAHPKTTEHRGR